MKFPLLSSLYLFFVFLCDNYLDLHVVVHYVNFTDQLVSRLTEISNSPLSCVSTQNIFRCDRFVGIFLSMLLPVRIYTPLAGCLGTVFLPIYFFSFLEGIKCKCCLVWFVESPLPSSPFLSLPLPSSPFLFSSIFSVFLYFLFIYL